MPYAKNPDPILIKISRMMDDLMDIAEHVEARERERRLATRDRPKAQISATGNVVPFPSAGRRSSLSE